MTQQHSAATRAAQPNAEQLKNTLSQNVSVSIASKIFYMLSRVFIPPLILSYVTLEEYGIWACCFVLVGYMGMSAFGISNVYIRYTAEYHVKNELDKINQLLSTGVIAVSGLSSLILVGLWFGLPSIIELFHIAATLHQTAFILIFVTAVTFLLDLSFGAFSDILTGLQRITQTMLIWVGTFMLETVLIVGLLLGGLGIYALLWAFVIRYVVSTIVSAACCYRAIPTLSLSLRHFDWTTLRLFYGYGGIVQLSGLLSMFLYSIEQLIAGVFIGVKATGLFNVGQKFPVMASQIPSSMNAVFLPAISQLHTLERQEDVAKLYLKGSRYLNMLTGILMGFLAAFAAPLMMVWMGTDEQFVLAGSILALFTLPFQMHVVTGPGSALHRGVKKPGRELVYPLTQLCLVILSVGLGFLFVGRTILVIGLAVAASRTLSALLYIGYTNRVLAVPHGMYVWKVLMPGVVPYAFGFGMAWLTQPWLSGLTDRWAILIPLGMSGLVYSLLVAVFLYRVVCDWGEREYLRQQIGHTLQRFLPMKWRPTPVAHQA